MHENYEIKPWLLRRILQQNSLTAPPPLLDALQTKILATPMMIPYRGASIENAPKTIYGTDACLPSDTTDRRLEEAEW